MNIMLSIIMLVAVLLTAVLVLIGVYVYRDAKRRGLNAVLWTLIAVFAPSLIGLIIYLLVRGNAPNLDCAQCGGAVAEDFVVCPKCGTKLRPMCANCSAPVEPDWKVCPRCAAPLEGVQEGVVPPKRRQDTGLSKILAVVIVLPVLLIGLMVLGSVAYSDVGGGAVSMFEVSIDDYLQHQESETIREEVQNWLDSLELRDRRAYVLRYDVPVDAQGGYHRFLVYVPAAGDAGSTSLGQSSAPWGTTIQLNLEHTGNSGYLLLIESTAARKPKLEVSIDHSPIPCEVTQADFDPTLLEYEFLKSG